MDGTTPRATLRSFVDKLRPIGLVQEAMFSGRYSPAIAAQVDGLQDKFRLATETVDAIFEAADQVVWTEIPGTRVFKHLSFMRRVVRNTLRASAPLANGSCPFIDKLPAEIRRKILIDELSVLPSRNLPIYPACGGDRGGLSNRPQRPNALADLMLLNKKIRNEIAEAVYEERTFAIHVHPGFQDAGIEFLHVGRQPLQYLDHIGDGRFTKFRTGEMFGFCRLKKIEVHIFPDDGVFQHSSINTYFMNIALVRLLTRNSDEEFDRITSIRIVFQEADPFKPTAVSSWWDTVKDRPRETSIHGISDVELVLRPFALLTHVHQVDVQLPEHVDRHVRSVKFVESLVHCMTATTQQGTFNSDALEMKIESARFALEDHIRRKLYGSGRRIDVPKITGEELEDDKQSQESEDDDDDDNDNMKITSEDDPPEDQPSSDMDGDQTPNASHDAAEYAMFDEDGGFPDDLDSLHEDMDVAPNALSEKVARFVECFSVTGDVARMYLDRNGEDLERACQNFMDMSDVEKAAKSKRRAFNDGPATPSEHSESTYPGGGSGAPSGAGEVDHKRKGNDMGKSENKKGKQRATRATDDDDNVYKNVRWDDDSDDEDDDDNHPNGSLSNNRFHALRAGQSSTQQEFDTASWQNFDPQNATRSQMQRRQRRLNALNHQRRRNFFTGGQDDHASSSTSGVNGSDRGRPTERDTLRLASHTTATTSSNNARGVARPSRTVVRRDSSTSLAANYSEDGQQVSEYRPYESPRTTTSRSQMVEQRMRYLMEIGDIDQDSTGHRSTSNDHFSPSHLPAQHDGAASSSRASNAFGGAQSQLNGVTNGFLNGHNPFTHNPFDDHTLTTQSEYHGLSLNEMGETSFSNAVFSELGSLHDSSSMQQPNAAESSAAAQLHASWNTGNYNPGGYDNAPLPIPGSYDSYVSALSVNEQRIQMELQRDLVRAGLLDPSPLFGLPVHAATHSTQQSSYSTTSNAVAPPSLQHSGLTSSLEDMDVDATEDASPEEELVGTKQQGDGDF